jgi:hypothetical protein
VRIKKDVDARRGAITLPRWTLALPVLFLVISAVGEGIGFLFGPGETGMKIRDVVRNRGRHMTKQDRLEFFGK